MNDYWKLAGIIIIFCLLSATIFEWLPSYLGLLP